MCQILRDQIIDDQLMYIPNYDQQNYNYVYYKTICGKVWIDGQTVVYIHHNT